MTLYRKAYGIMLNYDISSAEKAQAEKALTAFNIALRLLTIAEDHLDIMAIPFTDHPDIPPEQLVEYRAALRRFRDKAIENFNAFKVVAFKCITLMQHFSSDAQTSKLMKSFIASIDDVEKQVNTFSEFFDNLGATNFIANINKSTSLIKQEVDQLKEVIDDRIKSHIQSNILGKTWMDDVSHKLEMKIEKETPLILELNRQRQNILNGLKKKDSGQ